MINAYLVTFLLAGFGMITGPDNRATQDAPPRPWPITVPEEAFESLGNAGYLAAVLNLLDREKETLAEETYREMYLEFLATNFAYTGEHAQANERSDQAFGSRFAQIGLSKGRVLPPNLRAAPALEAIVEAAKDRRLVMVNEEHRSSVQRAFSNRLLAPLRELGFSYLAVETLSENTSILNEQGYPRLGTGTYTKDPAFGDLIRHALELNFTVIAYEAGPEEMRPRPDDTSPLDRMNRREQAQARNIFKQTFQVDPEAKVLVVGGRDHIAEGTGDQWTPMGGILKTLSGLDPLTINQSVMVEHSDRKFESWAYTAAEKAGWLGQEPVLLMSEQGILWSRSPESLDAYLFHPRTQYVQGRPHWMSMGGLRKPIQFECPPANTPILLQAIVKGEADDAIPLDQAIWWPEQPRPALFLRRGTYILRAIDRDGQIRHSREQQVE